VLMPIICGTDLSEASAGALDVARALAAQRGDSEVVLIHVIDPEAGDGPERSEAIEKARAELDATSARLTKPSVRTELVVGPPEESLCGFAETERSDLIVIAARSSEGSLLGRTAEKIVQRSGVPVLVVRDPAPWLAFARGERPLRVLLGIDES